MNDNIFNALLIIGLFGFVWLTVLANRHAKREKFPKVWLAVLGAAVLVDSIVFNFRVLPLFSDWIAFSIGTFLAGIVLAVILLLNEKKRGLAFVLLMPVFSIFFAGISNYITDPQIEGAREKADLILVRAEAFKTMNGDYPASLQELAHFDKLSIPKTGVGFWGRNDFSYYKHQEEGECSISFGAFVGIYHARSSGGIWYADD